MLDLFLVQLMKNACRHIKLFEAGLLMVVDVHLYWFDDIFLEQLHPLIHSLHVLVHSKVKPLNCRLDRRVVESRLLVLALLVQPKVVRFNSLHHWLLQAFFKLVLRLLDVLCELLQRCIVGQTERLELVDKPGSMLGVKLD